MQRQAYQAQFDKILGALEANQANNPVLIKM